MSPSPTPTPTPTPTPIPSYNLTPKVVAQNRVVSSYGTAQFTYEITNTNQSNPSKQTTWSVTRLTVPSGKPINKLEYTNSDGDPYRDNYSCSKLLELAEMNLVADSDKCEKDIASGKRVFQPGTLDMTGLVGGANELRLSGQYNVGTKICYVLTIDQPTEMNTPVNRFSSVACTTIGYMPFVQVWGGDLVAGRSFPSDINPTDVAHIKANVSTRSSSGGTTTYGSWSEYGAVASGDIYGFGTMRGLQGGVNNPNQLAWSKLTFANVQNEFGRFTETGGSLGRIPSMADRLLADRTPNYNVTDTNAIELGGEPSSRLYVYQKENGDLTINNSDIGKRKSIVIHVPDHNVIIAGNINYDDGPYGSISELPQVIIIAKNILINENVTNVDAWLLAYGDTNNGIINTCNRTGMSPTSNINIRLTIDNCNRTLKINGPIQARELLLRRTAGASAQGAPGEPAEILNLRADAYLWAHSVSGSDSRVQTTFATELPPYF